MTFAVANQVTSNATSFLVFTCHEIDSCWLQGVVPFGYHTASVIIIDDILLSAIILTLNQSVLVVTKQALSTSQGRERPVGVAEWVECLLPVLGANNDPFCFSEQLTTPPAMTHYQADNDSSCFSGQFTTQQAMTHSPAQQTMTHSALVNSSPLSRQWLILQPSRQWFILL